MPQYKTIGNSTIKVGDFTYGHDGLHIHQWGEGAALTIGKFCSIGHNVTIFLGGDHRTDWITTYPFGHVNAQYFGNPVIGHPKTKGNITIGNDVWIGADSKIMSGVTIGDGAIIAGSAVVVKDVESYSIVGGNPAKFLKYRFDQLIITLLKELAWWDLPINSIKEIIKDLCSSPSEELLNTLIKNNKGI